MPLLWQDQWLNGWEVAASTAPWSGTLEGHTTGGVAFSSSPQTVTLPATTQANDCILIAMDYASGHNPSGTVPSGAGATWVYESVSATLGLWIGYGCTAGATTIVLTGSTSTLGTFILGMFSGLTSTSSPFVSMTTPVVGSTGSAATTGAVTPALGQLLVGLSFSGSWAGGTPSWSAGFTDNLVDEGTTTRNPWMTYAIPTSTASTTYTSGVAAAGYTTTTQIVVLQGVGVSSPNVAATATYTFGTVGNWASLVSAPVINYSYLGLWNPGVEFGVKASTTYNYTTGGKTALGAASTTTYTYTGSGAAGLGVTASTTYTYTGWGSVGLGVSGGVTYTYTGSGNVGLAAPGGATYLFTTTGALELVISGAATYNFSTGGTVSVSGGSTTLYATGGAVYTFTSYAPAWKIVVQNVIPTDLSVGNAQLGWSAGTIYFGWSAGGTSLGWSGGQAQNWGGPTLGSG